MDNNLARYGDYVAEVTSDASAGMFHGRLIGIEDVIDFYAEDYKGLMQEFRNSVEEYIDMCRRPLQ